MAVLDQPSTEHEPASPPIDRKAIWAVAGTFCAIMAIVVISQMSAARDAREPLPLWATTHIEIKCGDDIIADEDAWTSFGVTAKSGEYYRTYEFPRTGGGYVQVVGVYNERFPNGWPVQANCDVSAN